LYSHVVQLTSPRKIVVVAGQLSVDVHGDVIGQGDFEAQVRQVFENLAGALESVGLGLRDVMKFTTYLTSPELIDRFYAVRETLFASLYPRGEYPGNTLLVVSRLVRPEFLIEIEAIAGT
jgi:enamine deaminase RidA (YjgF/YER057c/UK114 family)